MEANEHQTKQDIRLSCATRIRPSLGWLQTSCISGDSWLLQHLVGLLVGQLICGVESFTNNRVQSGDSLAFVCPDFGINDVHRHELQDGQIEEAVRKLSAVCANREVLADSKDFVVRVDGECSPTDGPGARVDSPDLMQQFRTRASVPLRQCIVRPCDRKVVAKWTEYSRSSRR
jgi:hypothetical protein